MEEERMTIVVLMEAIRIRRRMKDGMRDRAVDILCPVLDVSCFLW